MTDQEAKGSTLTRLRKAEQDVTDILRRNAELAADLKKTNDTLKSTLESVNALAKAVNQLNGGAPEDDQEPVCWLTIEDAGIADEVMTQLRLWADTVLGHYPNGKLKDCWMRHGYVVEELITLMALHREAWGPKGKVRDQMEWHARHRPDTMTRLNATGPYAEHTGLEDHDRISSARFPTPEQEGLDSPDAVVAWWVAEHGMTPDPRPSVAALTDSRNREEDYIRNS